MLYSTQWGGTAAEGLGGAEGRPKGNESTGRGRHFVFGRFVCAGLQQHPGARLVSIVCSIVQCSPAILQREGGAERLQGVSPQKNKTRPR